MAKQNIKHSTECVLFFLTVRILTLILHIYDIHIHYCTYFSLSITSLQVAEKGRNM